MAPATMFVFDCSTPSTPIPVGSFDLKADGDGLFTYGKTYLQRRNAFSIDPRHLPLRGDEMQLPRQPDNTYGVLSDSGPNSWGTNLTARLLRKVHNPLPRNAVEWFLQSKHFGSGCLAFVATPHSQLLLGKVQVRSNDLSPRLFDALDDYLTDPDQALDAETVTLLVPGGDLGGVRPKTIVMHDGQEHIAKFSRPDDLYDVPAAEYATLRLAYMTGITVPNFELRSIGTRSVLLVERFDRTEDGGRIHYLSANSFLRPKPLSEDRREYQTSFSYAAIAEALRTYSDTALEDAHELFRRMVLNIVVGNVDDHLRNHALLMAKPGVLRLSPAFDICPQLEAPFRGQNIGVGSHGTASTVENALSQCERFFLRREEALKIWAEVKAVTSTWRDVFAEAGISQKDRNRLAGCFAVADEATAVVVNLGDAGTHNEVLGQIKAPLPST
ncbi:type II toxin-antitoxin system HipA family toxin [Massilia terrae]|uniref:HipA domain-containing protein n=1 Tax=Massilia terrae TaxID=1811224 RepID=A0ABT2D5W6_9BURK|nr:HipA domain-containing protein [Massilia terrae]MCS0660770.1 HipA domain-containing protein [Massilia terrae]